MLDHAKIYKFNCKTYLASVAHGGTEPAAGALAVLPVTIIAARMVDRGWS
jgi:hypothetical protein